MSNMIERTPWRTTDDVIEGWDWSLPPSIKPVPYSGIKYHSRAGKTIPGNRICSIRSSWRELEPEEGVYDFGKLRKKLEDLPAGCVGAELHVYASVYETKYFKTGKVTPGTAPLWLIEKYKTPIVPEKPKTNIGTPFQVVNVDIWNEEYHSRYLKFVEAFGGSNIAQMKQIIPRHTEDIGCQGRSHIGLIPRFSDCGQYPLNLQSFMGGKNTLRTVENTGNGKPSEILLHHPRLPPGTNENGYITRNECFITDGCPVFASPAC